MKTKLLDLIDFKKVDTLFEGFYKTTGFLTAILDLEGNVLAKSGWRQICTEFHRINPETARNCRISDTELANKMAEGENYHFYKCLNGLVDVAVPIVIKGEHIANLLSGQFFFEEPNRDFFKKQAEKYGFDEKKYLEALIKVPVVSKNSVKVAIDFLLNMIQLISETTYQKQEQMEMNKSLRESEEKMRSIYSVVPAGIGVVVDRLLKEVNPRVCEITGYTREELIEKDARILYPSREEYDFVGHEKYNQIREKGTGKVETLWKKKDGSIINILLASTPIDKNDFSRGTIFTALDITVRKKAEKALLESDEMMRNSQAVAHICSYSTKLNENELEKSSWVCSPEFYKIFGIDETYPHTIAGWADFIHPDYREELIAYHEYVVKKRTMFSRDYKIIRINDGAERWVHGTGKLEFDEKGNPVRMHGAIQDITERKRAEMVKQIQYNIANAVISAENLNDLFDSIKNEMNSIIDAKNFVIAFYNEETRMLSANVDRDEKGEIPEWPAEKSLTGYVIRQNRPVLLRKNEILRLYEEGIIELFGTISETWLGVPLKVEGKILGAVVVQNYDNPDVYDQTSIEILELVAHELSIFIDWQRAEEKAAKLSRAVEQSSISVVITNKDGLIEYVNSFFTEVTGYRFEEVIGKNPGILNSGHHPKAFYKALWRTILSGNNWEGEMLNKKKNGDLYWEQAVISPILNNEGVITNFVAIKEDITERKRMLEELVAAKEKAQESDKLKTAFINNISHEIRTPLNGILGFGAFLSETDLSPEAKKEMLAIVQQSSNRLMNTVENYMDMARIVSGTMEVHKNEFVLQPFFEEVIEKTKKLCASKQISFEFVSQPEYVDLTLDSDPELIRKTINLLLDNALKFTEKGSITCGYNPKNGFIEFFVKDTGKGVAPKRLDAIFNIFTQEDSSDTRGYEGSGLGLSIAGGLIKLLGGTVSVSSELGKGSVFTFTVPYKKKEVTEKAAPAEKKNSIVTGKPLVLLAEDEESNYLYMEVVLKLAGCDYLLAKDGAEAVEFCKQHPGIALVLMDIKMPVMNGLEATRLIREFRPDLPIIATTAYAQTGDKHRFLAAGCDGYLEKPTRKEQLLALLKKYFT